MKSQNVCWVPSGLRFVSDSAGGVTFEGLEVVVVGFAASVALDAADLGLDLAAFLGSGEVSLAISPCSSSSGLARLRRVVFVALCFGAAASAEAELSSVYFGTVDVV